MTCARALLLALLVAGPAAADRTAAGRIVLEDTRVTGNQELPKVLYLLPWQRPGGPEGLTLPPALDHGALFEPIEPAAYRRLLRVRAHLGGAAALDPAIDPVPQED